jgi:hypothetical protein
LSVEKGIFQHGKESHPEFSFKNASVVREVKDQMQMLRCRYACDYSTFLKTDSEPEDFWFCSICFIPFAKHSNYQRHLELRRGKCSNGKGDKKRQLYSTICGRKGPRFIVDSSERPVMVGTTAGGSLSSKSHVFIGPSEAIVSSTVPAQLMYSHEEATQLLAPFVRKDEDPSDLSLIYFPLRGPSFEGTMRQYLTYTHTKATTDEPVLHKWLEAARTWLTDYAAGHILNVSANVRHRLAEFEQRELEGVTVGTNTFILRKGISRLVSELECALRFFFRYPTILFDEWKRINPHVDVKWMIENAIIPKILYAVA